MMKLTNEDEHTISEYAVIPVLFSLTSTGCLNCTCPVKVHHFAHRSTTSCGYGKGESELHMDLKMQVYDVLNAHREVAYVAMEVAVGDVRPDVLAVIRGQQVAFEIQVSSLSIEDLYRRTAACAAQDIAMIWILHWPEGTTLGRLYRPASWERWLHTCGMATLYFWAGDGWVRPVRLGNRQHGLQKAPRAHLVDDFEPKRIGGWVKGDFLIPARFIWNRVKCNQ